MGSITHLIGEFHQGSQTAFGALFQRFFPGSVTRLQRRLGPAYPGIDGAEDVALSVFRRLWQTVEEARPLAGDLTDRLSLLRILTLLTEQKLRESWRTDFRQCRDVRRTVRESDQAGEPDDALSLADTPALGRPPEWDVVFLDLLAHLLGLLTERQQTIVLNKMAGRSAREIAEDLGCSERSIERQLSEIRDRWRDHPDLAALLPPPA